MVGAGDEIVKVGEANERMTVAEINALLYSSDHARDRLQRALRIAALSPGWRASFEALLRSQTTAGGSGNAGLVPAAAMHPVAPGFHPLAVVAIDWESADVLSVSMQDPDGKPLPQAQPGQYVVLRLRRAGGSPPLFRSYSLSGPLLTDRYRISVKIEPNGAAGTYLREHVRLGNVLDVSAPRGSFVLQMGSGPWCWSARASERRRFWQCCTRSRLPARHGRCYGCTRLATGSIIHLPPKSSASCPPLPMAASTLLTAARPHATGWARISTTPAACRAPSSAR